MCAATYYIEQFDIRIVKLWNLPYDLWVEDTVDVWNVLKVKYSMDEY